MRTHLQLEHLNLLRAMVLLNQENYFPTNFSKSASNQGKIIRNKCQTNLPATILQDISTD